VQTDLIRPVGSGRWTTHRLTDEAEARGKFEIESPTEPSQIRSEKAAPILELLEQKGELSSSEFAEAFKLPGSTTRFWPKRLAACPIEGNPSALPVRRPG